MTNLFYARSLVFILLIFSNAASSAVSQSHSYPSLTMHGELYENSCSTKEKQKLMSEIKTNASVNILALQKTIEFILCGADADNNNRKMISLIDEVVVTSYEGTAEEKVVKKLQKKMEVLKDMMAKGRAWNATLNFDNNEVILQYFSSAACVESVKLRSFKNSWVVHEIGGACD